MSTATSRAALRSATVIGTVLQLAMVGSGHWVGFIRMNGLALGGLGIALVAGVRYARAARVPRGPAALNGAIAGGAPRAAAAVLALTLISIRAVAQQAPGPRSPAATRPAATTADLAWLAGTWEGRVTGKPGTADVTFAAPRAGLITGVMRLIDQDRVLVVELITIVDTPNGPELRFRHFSAALEAYETEFRQTLRLTSHSADRDVFENQVGFDARLMSTQPRVASFLRHGRDEFVGHSDILDEHGHPGVVEVTYRRRNVQ